MKRFWQSQWQSWTRPFRNLRRGTFAVVGALGLVGCMTFVAFSVDLGVLSLTRTKMQNATDAAALAAAMEITNALSNAGSGVGDVFNYAKGQARSTAGTVASLNGIYVDPSIDVIFGRRQYNPSNATFTTEWSPNGNEINVVKVVARKDNPNKAAPDAKVPALFSAVMGHTGTILRTESVAFIEPRDIVVVHDFSRSMNFDSYFTNETATRLSQAQIEGNISLVWQDLGSKTYGSLPYTPIYFAQSKSTSNANANVTFQGKTINVTTNTKIKSVKIYFTDGNSQTFSVNNESTTNANYTGTGNNANKRINGADITIRRVGSSSQNHSLTGYAYTTSSVRSGFGIANLSYPYAAGSWDGYVNEVMSSSYGLAEYGYQDRYGMMTFVCYIMRQYASQHETKDLWKTRHYPFHAIKEGHILLCNFLEELKFDDHIGMVSYDTNHRIESTLSSATNPDFPNVDISAKPITNNYDALRKLMKYKQAAHYSDATNMSGGLKDAISLLNNHKRAGSRPTILLMTDGNSNTLDSGENGNLPNDWDWNVLFDYNGDGAADYSTTNSQTKAVLKYVKQAVDNGYTVHAISVGADADRNLLKAVAWLGNGHWIDVPGGSSVSDMETQVRDAFTKIASAVPPARLLPASN